MLFFYKRRFKADEKSEEKVYNDCINVDTVVRGVWADDDTFVVLLNDRHEASEIVEPPIFNKEGKKVKEAVKSRVSKVSEVFLEKDDAQRFKQLFEVEDYDTLVHTHD